MSEPSLPPGFLDLDFGEFHRSELPRRLAAGNGALAAEQAAAAGPIAFRVGGRSYTYLPADGGIEVREGDDEARTVVELDLHSWRGLAQDLESAPGLLYAGRATGTRGNPMRFVRWDPVLRAMFHGRPIFDPERSDLRDRHGAPLDPRAGFRVDGDREEMAHYLATAGFLRAREVFAADEVARFRELAAVLRAEAVEGDRKSWWAKDAGGRSVCCRVTNAARFPEFADLYRDPRITGLASLADPPLVARAAGSEEGVSVLWKTPGMTEGLSDIPWHRDCGMGGHAVMCPILIFTVNLQDGTPEAGELKVLPGSHRASYPFTDPSDPKAPAGVPLATRAGDVSLHYGDLMHAAPPPTSEQGPHRVSVLLAWVPDGARHHRGERHYNDVLLSRDDGQVEHLGDVVARGDRDA